jgi:hypothetical protein
MEGGPALPADPAPGQAAQELLARDVEKDHAVEVLAETAQQRVEGLGLGHRAREAVQHVARTGVGPREPLVHQADHDLVGHERALVHEALGLAPERRARGHRLAEHVAGGHLGDAGARGEPPGLGPLARARGPEEDHAAHAPFAFLRRKPS